MAEESPDLKYILVEIGRVMNALHPDVVTKDHIRRLDDSTNVLLVLTRILTSIAKNHGLDGDELVSITERSRKAPAVKSDLFETETYTSGKITGKVDDYQLMSMIDKMLLESGRDCPEWFVNEYWPGCLRRAARGRGLTDRQRSVAMYVHSTVRGEV